jgi:hypothetical protein
MDIILSLSFDVLTLLFETLYCKQWYLPHSIH